MALDDDTRLLDRPIGFAVGINRESTIDAEKQRERLPGLLRFVRTFAAHLLEAEFGTTLGGYPDPARARAEELLVKLRSGGEETVAARAVISVLIDLMELEADHQDASPHNDEDEQEDFHDGILTFVERLLERFATFTSSTGRLPKLTAEAQRGHDEFTKAAARLAL